MTVRRTVDTKTAAVTCLQAAKQPIIRRILLVRRKTFTYDSVSGNDFAWAIFLTNHFPITNMSALQNQSLSPNNNHVCFGQIAAIHHFQFAQVLCCKRYKSDHQFSLFCDNTMYPFVSFCIACIILYHFVSLRAVCSFRITLYHLVSFCSTKYNNSHSFVRTWFWAHWNMWQIL